MGGEPYDPAEASVNPALDTPTRRAAFSAVRPATPPSPQRPDEMELLICVVNREDQLEAVLAGFLELGISGATVIRSEGMGKVLREVPVFAGLQQLMRSERPANTTVFSVIDSPSRAAAAVAMIRRVCGNLDVPGSGIVFTVPVTRAEGLAPPLSTD